MAAALIWWPAPQNTSEIANSPSQLVVESFFLLESFFTFLFQSSFQTLKLFQMSRYSSSTLWTFGTRSCNGEMFCLWHHFSLLVHFIVIFQSWCEKKALFHCNREQFLIILVWDRAPTKPTAEWARWEYLFWNKRVRVSLFSFSFFWGPFRSFSSEWWSPSILLAAAKDAPSKDTQEWYLDY